MAGLWYRTAPLVAMGALLLTIYTRFDNPQRDLETKFQLLQQKVEVISATSESGLTTLRASILENSSKDDTLRLEVADLNRKLDQIIYALEYDAKPSQTTPPIPLRSNFIN